MSRKPSITDTTNLVDRPAVLAFRGGKHDMTIRWLGNGLEPEPKSGKTEKYTSKESAPLAQHIGRFAILFALTVAGYGAGHVFGNVASHGSLTSERAPISEGGKTFLEVSGASIGAVTGLGAANALSRKMAADRERAQRNQERINRINTRKSRQNQ